jgi:two-component system, LuxR family, sensor kinase FixL
MIPMGDLHQQEARTRTAAWMRQARLRLGAGSGKLAMRSASTLREWYQGLSPALRISAIYVLGAATGLLLPDELLGKVVTDPAMLTRMRVLLGTIFTVTMGGALYVVVRRSMAAQQERFRSLIHNVLDGSAAGICILDANFKVVWTNQALERYLGLSRSELLGQDRRQVTREQSRGIFEDPDGFAAKLLAAYDDNSYIENFECHVLPSAQRDERWLEHWSQPIRTGLYAGGRIEHYTDVTERRRSQETLRLLAEGTSSAIGEEFFRSLVRYLAAALQVRFAFIAERLEGSKVRLLSLWTGFGYDAAFDYATEGTPCADIATKPMVYHPAHVRELFPNGSWLSRYGVESYAAIPLFDNAGRALGHMGVMDDKSMDAQPPQLSVLQIFAARASAEIERKRAEQALRESEERFRQMAESVKEVFWMTDAELTRVIYVSPAYEDLWGRPCESLYAAPRSFLDAVHPDDRERVRAAFERLSGDKVFEEEFRILRPDGSLRRIWDRAFPVRDPTGRVYRIVGVAQDVTERTQAEERARQREAELAHVVRLGTMGEMTASLAHEINQPLSAIANYARGCVRRLHAGAGTGEDVLAAVEQIYAQAERAGEIIRRLRSFVRKQEPRRSRVHIKELVQEVIGFVRAEARDKHIAIRLELGERLCPVMVDKVQIEQVMLNLVRNSIESITDNGSENRVLTIRASMSGDAGVEVAVSDTGHGLAADVVDHLFEPFFTTKPSGMGMGLSISRSIVATHGGRLWATPGPEGAVFTFTLPALSTTGESCDDIL